ncbi:hypothetical protein ASF27_01630 [Methylobacterium sp. Leaf102]|uniref:hypothetical protein n=1 Tax=Methylobacterium sp. Leaf102 TaxID=1736253 RepID=UPI0006FF85D3|nr:hypothetical protein [Methylobacterium sp. Leaf102]KQP34289.1 hypothetical protein ASF27_01630 [Methylobacterium sp. Leaf102]
MTDHPAPLAPPITTRFQVLFGPDGAARIVLFADTSAEDRPIATLDLDAADGDLLARLLTTRRATYDEQRRNHEAGAQQ